MELQRTPLYDEVMDVYAKCDKNTNVFYQATLIGMGALAQGYDPIEVVSLTIQRDHADNFADETSITLKMPLGKFAYKVWPNRTTLRVSLKRITLDEGGGKLIDAPIQTELFSAVLIEERSALVALQGNESKDEEALDLISILDVKFQLFDMCLERVRCVQVGGIYRQCTVEGLLKYKIVDINSKIKVAQAKAITALEMVDVNNTIEREQLVIPAGVNIVDLPGYIQAKYGVYNADIGSYIQNRCWYIYPLFDTSLFTKSKKTVSIYILPSNKFPEVERSYMKRGDSISILSVAKTDFGKDNDINYIVSGNGVRYTNAGIVMEGFADTKGNVTTVDRSKNNSEYVATKQGNALTNAPVAQTKITDNPFVEFSKLAKRKGGIFKVQWINSDPGSLIPGMAARMVYVVGDVLQEAYGVLVGATHICVKVGGTGSDKHTTNSVLYFFANLDPSGTQ